MAPALVGLLAVVVILVAVLVFVLGRGRGPKSILVVGPVGAGKTLLFYRLVDGTGCETVTSMRVNRGTWEDWEVVDFPGHYRLRGGLADAMGRATKVIFVVDSAAMSAQAKPAAELLFDILTHPKAPTDLLVVCNKSDKATAKTPQRVKLTLMNEIETLRKTANTIENVDGVDRQRRPLGVQGQFFNFDLHAPFPITFLPLAIKNDDLGPVVAYLTGSNINKKNPSSS